MYNRFPCYGAMICFEGRKNYREKKETKVKSRCGTLESCIGFVNFAKILKNLFYWFISALISSSGVVIGAIP